MKKDEKKKDDPPPRCNCKLAGSNMPVRVPSGHCDVHGAG